MLNGGSSSGKTSIARQLQNELTTQPWLTFGVDSLMASLPAQWQSEDGIEFAANGSITVGHEFKKIDAAWREGIAAMVRAGTKIVVDEVFLSGATAQQQWRSALHDLEVLWVGVHCQPRIAAAREAAREDRISGMAMSQAEIVHKGVDYDVTVDTSQLTTSQACAAIRAALGG